MEFCFFLLFLVSIVFIEGKSSVYKSVCLGKREILVIEKTHAIFRISQVKKSAWFQNRKMNQWHRMEFCPDNEKKMSHRKKCSEALIWTVIRWGSYQRIQKLENHVELLQSRVIVLHNTTRLRWSIPPSLLGTCSLKFCLFHSQWEWSL